MKTAVLVALALAVAGATPGLAQTFPPPPQGIENTSSVESNGNRVLQLAVIIHAPPSAVWAALNSAEGWRSWAAPVAQVDFRVGGVIETSYNAQAHIGDRANIRNEIVAYVPERMLAIRNVQAPPGFEPAAAFQRTVTVIELAPTADGTRVTLTNVGYGPGHEFDSAYRHFEWGDAVSLDALRQRFEGAGETNAR